MRVMPRSLMRRLHGIMFKLPMMITCEVFEDFILAYLDDELSDKQRRLFEIHLRFCRECREYLAAYQRARALTREALDAESREVLANVPEDLVSAIMAARDA